MQPVTIDPGTDWPLKHAFRPGDVVRIPQGATVHSTHPARKEYVTVRAQKVKVHHLLSGRFVSVREALDEHRAQLQTQGLDLSDLERWRTDNAREYYVRMVQIEGPSVRWAGTGGYWCEVPVAVVEKISQSN